MSDPIFVRFVSFPAQLQSLTLAAESHITAMATFPEWRNKTYSGFMRDLCVRALWEPLTQGFEEEVHRFTGGFDFGTGDTVDANTFQNALFSHLIMGRYLGPQSVRVPDDQDDPQAAIEFGQQLRLKQRAIVNITKAFERTKAYKFTDPTGVSWMTEDQAGRFDIYNSFRLNKGNIDAAFELVMRKYFGPKWHNNTDDDCRPRNHIDDIENVIEALRYLTGDLITSEEKEACPISSLHALRVCMDYIVETGMKSEDVYTDAKVGEMACL